MLVCVTDRRLCREDFYIRLERILRNRPGLLILREKDLPDVEYRCMAKRCMALCDRYAVPLCVNSRVQIAKEIGCEGIHLPYRAFLEQQQMLSGFRRIGVSVHSPEEAKALQTSCATYLVAGHIYDTACKEGLPGRGAAFLRQVCEAAAQPVYAIGGVTAGRLPEVLEAGAVGACVMSQLMACEDVDAAMHVLQQ